MSWSVSAWFLLAVPFSVAAGFAAWLGLSGAEMLDAVSDWDDPGAGTAGMSP